MKIKNIAIVTALATMPLAAQAGITSDATITDINGIGNPDGGWYEVSNGGISIGARVKDRASGAIVENGNNYTPIVSAQGWNLEFSFDVTGTGDTLISSSYHYFLSVDGGSAIDLTLLPDNAYGTESTANGAGAIGVFATTASANTVMQNSERYLYLGITDQTSYHTFDFFVTDANGGLLDSDTITVNAAPVPEPSTYIAAALLLVPLGISSARLLRRRSAANA